MVALLYMFRSALNIYSSKEYIYIMDDALSFIYFFFFLGTMDVFSLFNLYVYMCLELCIFWKLILIVPNAKKYLHNIFMYSSQTVK